MRMNWMRGSGCIIKQNPRTLYNASRISSNCSGVRLPGSIPLTSRPKSANFDASALAGRGSDTSSIAIGDVVVEERKR